METVIEETRGDFTELFAPPRRYLGAVGRRRLTYSTGWAGYARDGAELGVWRHRDEAVDNVLTAAEPNRVHGAGEVA